MSDPLSKINTPRGGLEKLADSIPATRYKQKEMRREADRIFARRSPASTRAVSRVNVSRSGCSARAASSIWTKWRAPRTSCAVH